MQRHRFLATAFPWILLTGVVVGCTILKAQPAPDSGFLAQPERMEEHRERAPFHRAWFDPAFDPADYDAILVAPVNTNHVLEQSTWAKASIGNITFEADLQGIADDFRQTIIAEFRESEGNRFAVVDRATKKTMILELAITELVPGKAFLGAIGLAAWAAPLAVGVPVGVVATFADDGWMAIEGRIRDAQSRRVRAMFADREGAKTRILDLEAVTWYGHARESMNDWAAQIATLANTPKDVQVEDSSAFTLLPW